MTFLKGRYCVLLLLFVSLGVYYPVIFAPFNSVDDPKLINYLLNLDHFSLKQLFLPGGGYYYRPLLRASFIADKYLWGIEESFMHLENILLHAVNVLLVFFLARRILRNAGFAGNLPPFIAALLFALHPINTEAVNWISGRTDILAGFFILLSGLVLHAALDRDSLVLCVVSAVLLWVGCFAKETAVFFMPAVLFLMCAHDREQHLSFLGSLRRRWLFHGFFVAAAFAYLSFRKLALTHGDSGIRHAAKSIVGPEAHHWYTLKVIFKVSGFYLKKMFIPWPLNFGIIQVSNWYILLGVVIIGLTVYFVIRRDMVAALFLASITVGSSALIVAISRMAWTHIAERYMYIPSAFFCIAIVLALAPFARKSSGGPAALAVLLPGFFLACAWSTTARNMTWQDNLALFEDTMRKSPDFAPAKNEFAGALLERGRVEQAREVFMSNSVAASVKHSQIVGLNKAYMLAKGGDLEGARKLLRDLLRDPGKQEKEIIGNLTAVNEMILAKGAGDRERRAIVDEVTGLLKRGHELTGDPFYLYRIGQYCLAAHRPAEARDYFARAFQDAPDGAHYKEAARKLADKLR